MEKGKEDADRYQMLDEIKVNGSWALTERTAEDRGQ